MKTHADVVANARQELSMHGMSVPADESKLLMAAYQLMAERDPLLAHQYRLGKTHKDFTREDWVSSLQISGDRLSRLPGAVAACARFGIELFRGFKTSPGL